MWMYCVQYSIWNNFGQPICAQKNMEHNLVLFNFSALKSNIYFFNIHVLFILLQVFLILFLIFQ